jgi:DNA-directed RNA polymerase specialized sigma24 family protein
MFEKTVSENFKTWDKFHAAYARPIRAAFAILAGEDQADELAQGFFVKLFEKNILEARAAIKGPFRNWLYVAVKHHAIDQSRKEARHHGRNGVLHGDDEPADPRARDPERDETPFDADEFYALSVIHLAVSRVRKHLIEEGKVEHWTIFDELTLAPLTPGRLARSRDELLAMFPGRPPVFLDNRMTTVKRVFRRILRAVIPADPARKLSPEERFEEILEIIGTSQKNRLWLAFLEAPAPSPGATADPSLEMVARSVSAESPDRDRDRVREPEPKPDVSEDMLHDELRVLLAFWLEMPFHEYLDGLDGAGPALARAVRPERPHAARARPAAPPLYLRGLIDGAHPDVPPRELLVLLEALKSYAKVVHKLAKATGQRGRARRQSSMPAEVAQVLYNLAGALALTRCGSRIVGLEDGQYRKNVAWVLSQPWLDARLRPVFYAALQALGPR